MGKNRLACVIVEEEYYGEFGYRACFVEEGVAGYRPTGNWPYLGGVGETLPWFFGHDFAAAKARAEKYNQRLGISPEEAEKILFSTFFVAPKRAKSK